MMFCRDICTHFLRITRTYKILQTLGSAQKNYIKRENYNRCGYCNILLKKIYNICPCCNNKRLSFNPQRDGRKP